jgi:hypothetical protein
LATELRMALRRRSSALPAGCWRTAAPADITAATSQFIDGVKEVTPFWPTW